MSSSGDGMVSDMFPAPRLLVALPLIMFFACSVCVASPEAFHCTVSSNEPFLDQANRFLLAQLRYQPVEATQAGYHGDAQAHLDDRLDDFGPETIASERALYLAGKQCFAATKPKTGEDAADLTLLRDSIESSLFQLDSLQSYRNRPQDYVEMIGSGLFFPLTSTRGTEQERVSGVLARMEQIPRVLEQARANIKASDPVFIDTALGENAGNPGVIEQIGGMIPAGSPLRPRFEAASKAAVAALYSFDTWLKDDLGRRPSSFTWRAGPATYRKIFALALGSGTRETPESVLAAAERQLTVVRSEMYAVALPLHKQWFPDHRDHGELKGDALQNKIVGEVIDRINDDHVEPGELLDKVRSQTAGIRAFLQQKDLLTLSDRDNMKVVATPEFMRGIFSVAGFHPAPPLDPSAEAEYWVTPIDPKMPKEKAESKLREYNNWMLQYLTMHEALPGHYTQFEHADNVQPPSRRILRALLANGAYEEGWGEYGVKEMEDAGYANHDPRFVLMVQKIRLRVIANAILDVRMQSRGMTDQQALDLMQNKAFQTAAEAQGKLRRAKLSAGQLIFYFVGYRQWIDLRDSLQRDEGAAFSLKRFNDAALDEGPLPVPMLAPLLTGKLAIH